VLKLTPARLGQGYVGLPIEKRRQYEEKAVYLSPQSKLLHELMRYTIEHGLGRDDRFWPMTRQHAHTIVTTVAAAYRLEPERRDSVLLEVRTPAWPHLFRHGAATAMLEDSDDDAVFVRERLGHRNIRETLHYAALSDAKRREKAARLRRPASWRAARAGDSDLVRRTGAYGAVRHLAGRGSGRGSPQWPHERRLHPRLRDTRAVPQGTRAADRKTYRGRLHLSAPRGHRAIATSAGGYTKTT